MKESGSLGGVHAGSALWICQWVCRASFYFQIIKYINFIYNQDMAEQLLNLSFRFKKINLVD